MIKKKLPGKLIILDLDETLIYASASELSHPYDFATEQYYVYKRPFLNELLEFCFQHFSVAVWSSSNELYATRIVSNIFSSDYPPVFLWARNRCVARFNHETWSYDFIKDLKKVRKKGYDLAQVLVLDDTPSKLRRNYGNLICIQPFDGTEDRELLLVKSYLDIIKDCRNYRKIDKRSWRAQTQNSAEWKANSKDT